MQGFERWYFDQHRRVLAGCLALTGNQDVAREATDEAFTRALERWASVATMASPGGWVQVVALNHARRMLRRRGIERRSASRGLRVETTEAVLPCPELWAAVRGLPNRQQMAVILRYVGDLPEDEIAVVMGIKRGSVASTLHDARLRLRGVLGDHEEKEPVHD